jgi:anaphase-promoting complex subunit 10
MPRSYLHHRAAAAAAAEGAARRGPPAAEGGGRPIRLDLDDEEEEERYYEAVMGPPAVDPAGVAGGAGGGTGSGVSDSGGGADRGSSIDADSDASDDDDDEEEDDDDEEEEEEEDDDGDDATMTDAPAVPEAGSTDPAGDAREEGDDEDGGRTSPTSAAMLVIKAAPNLDRLFGLREMGREALCWQLSSAKPGNGVEQIRDDSVDTYWQSDGTSQPHWIQASFGRRVAISHVCLYLDYGLDESYTPRRVQVQVGMTDQDLISAMHPPMTQVELQEPTGWCIIPLSSPPDPLDDCCPASSAGKDPSANRGFVRAHLIRISILSMHQNGRDTHVRQVQLYGPRLIGGSHAAAAAAAQAAADPSSSSVPSSKPQERPDLYRVATSRPSYYPVSFQTVEASQFSSIR